MAKPGELTAKQAALVREYFAERDANGRDALRAAGRIDAARRPNCTTGMATGMRSQNETIETTSARLLKRLIPLPVWLAMMDDRRKELCDDLFGSPQKAYLTIKAKLQQNSAK